MNIRIRSYFKRKGGKLVAVKGYTRGSSSKSVGKSLKKAVKAAKGKKEDVPLTYREWLSEMEGGKKAKKAQEAAKKKEQLKGKGKKKKGEPTVQYTKPQGTPKTGRA